MWFRILFLEKRLKEGEHVCVVERKRKGSSARNLDWIAGRKIPVNLTDGVVNVFVLIIQIKPWRLHRVTTASSVLNAWYSTLPCPLFAIFIGARGSVFSFSSVSDNTSDRQSKFINIKLTLRDNSNYLFNCFLDLEFIHH